MMRAALTLSLLFGTHTLTAQQAALPNGWPVVHQRLLWWDAEGTLATGEDGLVFTPTAKRPAEAKPLALDWDAIQQLTLAERSVEIVTYRDVLWQAGRDRHYRFAVPKSAKADLAAMEPTLRAALGSRLVIALASGAGQAAAPLWELPAKRTGLLGGAEGTLLFTGDELVFSTSRAEWSRRWPLASIDTIAQTGPLAFTVTVPERAMADQGGYRSFSFQLKQPLSVERYRELWRAIERAHGTRLGFRGAQ